MSIYIDLKTMFAKKRKHYRKALYHEIVIGLCLGSIGMFQF